MRQDRGEGGKFELGGSYRWRDEEGYLEREMRKDIWRLKIG